MNGTSCADESRFFTFSCAMIVTPSEPKKAFPPVWSKCQCVFTSRVTGRIVVLKIASLSSVIREASPLSITKVLPSSTTAVTLPPSPEKTNRPWPREVIVSGLFSNCSVAFWMTGRPDQGCGRCPVSRQRLDEGGKRWRCGRRSDCHFTYRKDTSDLLRRYGWRMALARIRRDG